MKKLASLRKSLAFRVPSGLLLIMGMLFGIGVVTVDLHPAVVNADRGRENAEAFVGTYLLRNQPGGNFPDGRQRLVTLHKDGNFTSLSQQSLFLGFEEGKGTWEKTGQNEITSLSISFSYDADGNPTGAFVDTYTLTFGDKDKGKYQTVTGGNVSGDRFPLGVNPLDPGDIDPISSFSLDVVDGQRVK